METGTQETEYVSLGSYAKVLRDRKWWVIGSVVVFLGIALAWSFFLATPTYRATAGMLRRTTTFDQALFNTQLFQQPDVQRELQTGSRLVKLDTVAEMVKKELGSGRSATSLLDITSVDPQADADIIEISAVSTSAAESAAVADSFARQFILYRQSADRAALSQAMAQVERELAAMTSTERKAERGVVLSQKVEELGILRSMQTGGYEVVQRASVPTSPASPRPLRNAFLAVVAGLLFGVVLAFVVDRADRRIKTADALEKEFGLPVLATIPRLGRHWSPPAIQEGGAAVSFSDSSPRFVESFRALRSNLQYFEFDRQIRTIVITSGLPREGKSITTVNLAISLALSGARVVVLEADLRRPKIHEYLGLADAGGVSTVLAGSQSFQNGLQLVRVNGRPQSGSNGRDPAQEPASRPAHIERNFYCLTSGPLPPNPAELIGSQRMRTLIEDAAAVADYVLIDTPPMLVVADAVSLASLADAVIVCSRINATTIEEAHEMRTLLSRTGSHALGLVAGGSKTRNRHNSSSYGGYYASPESGQSHSRPPLNATFGPPAREGSVTMAADGGTEPTGGLAAGGEYAPGDVGATRPLG